MLQSDKEETDRNYQAGKKIILFLVFSFSTRLFIKIGSFSPLLCKDLEILVHCIVEI